MERRASRITHARHYFREQGLRATVQRAAGVLLEALTPPTLEATHDRVEQIVERRFVSASQLPVRSEPAGRPRITLVTDTINPPHLYGGIGTGLLLATLLSERLGRELRIVTRHARAEEKNFSHIMQVGGIVPRIPVSFEFVGFGAKKPALPVRPDELFFTTSWWTTAGTLATVPAERIIYLLQEDERMFYAGGDEHLRCSETLASRGLTFLINTQMLFEHLVSSGLSNLAEHGLWFEPSFPEDLFSPSEPKAGPPYRFMFYARPHNLRNLFFRGIEALSAAVRQGVLDPAEWELCFVGKDIPRMELGHGVKPRLYENLSWLAYAALTRTMDLGLSLMYTPHPSYPPLDLAASGAVVVTNRYAGKQTLSRYSDNILCVEPTVEDLVAGLRAGVELARDSERRLANYRRNRLLRDWRVSFAGPIEALAKKFA